MNEQDRQLAEIRRDEAWLAEFAAPEPDPIAMERIKYVVRHACGEGTPLSAGETAKALAQAKAAVRRELDVSAARERAVVFRPWAPVLVAAASIAFAFVTFWTGRATDAIEDPDLAVFVTVMARPEDRMSATLWELEDDITALVSGSDAGELDTWDRPSLFDFEDAREPPAIDGQRSEENS
jgi:hypothetical protein